MRRAVDFAFALLLPEVTGLLTFFNLPARYYLMKGLITGSNSAFGSEIVA